MWENSIDLESKTKENCGMTLEQLGNVLGCLHFNRTVLRTRPLIHEHLTRDVYFKSSPVSTLIEEC